MKEIVYPEFLINKEHIDKLRSKKSLDSFIHARISGLSERTRYEDKNPLIDYYFEDFFKKYKKSIQKKFKPLVEEALKNEETLNNLIHDILKKMYKEIFDIVYNEEDYYVVSYDEIKTKHKEISIREYMTSPLSYTVYFRNMTYDISNLEYSFNRHIDEFIHSKTIGLSGNKVLYVVPFIKDNYEFFKNLIVKIDVVLPFQALFILTENNKLVEDKFSSNNEVIKQKRDYIKQYFKNYQIISIERLLADYEDFRKLAVIEKDLYFDAVDIEKMKAIKTQVDIKN